MKPRLLALASAVMLLAAACGGAEPDADGAAEDAATMEPEQTDEDDLNGSGEDDPNGSGEIDLEAGYAFFAENDIEMALAVDPGGGMDAYARAIAAGLAEQLDNSIQVTHRTGAGGATVGNWLTSNAGNATVLTFNRVSGWVLSQLTGDERVNYDITEWNAIGRVVAEPRAISVGAHTGIESLEEMLTTEGLRFGATDLGGGDWVDATVIVNAFGLDAEVVAGFEGSAATELAVIRGDVDAQTGSPASRLGAEQAGDILQIGAIGAMPGEDEVVDISRVTLASDLDHLIDGEEGSLLLETHSNIIEMGRGLFAPPDLDANQLAALRDAFRNMILDEEWLSQMEADGRPVDAIGGEELQSLIVNVAESIPDAYIELINVAD